MSASAALHMDWPDELAEVLGRYPRVATHIGCSAKAIDRDRSSLPICLSRRICFSAPQVLPAQNSEVATCQWGLRHRY